MADPFEVVDCLIPGQIRQLGTQMTYVTPRRPVHTTAEECAMGGGEYVVHDRADYKTALKFWLSEVQKVDDADAQYYIGVLYERGAENGQPNYTKAAEWYRKAAERGMRRAAINLGRLYEKGLGVKPSEEEARSWYAKASGVLDASTQVGVLPVFSGEATQQELAATRARLAEQMGLLRDEQHQLDELKRQAASSGQGKVSADVVAKQERVQDRQKEVETLQHKVTVLTEAVRRTSSAPGRQGPSIQIIDPLVVITRDIIVEEGRVPIVIPSGRPYRLTGRVLAEGAVRTVEVNGVRTQLDEQGVFVVQLDTLKRATKGVPVDIVAVDHHNKQDSRRYIVTYGQTIQTQYGAIPRTRPIGSYHALVIGNNHYRHWARLSTPIADAEALATVLRERYGFEVTTLSDATFEQIMKALNDYKKTLSDQDHLLIYYAGHGYLEPKIDRGYWIPVDAEALDNTKWIDFPKITDLLQLIQARQVLVIADSCFAGKLTSAAFTRMNPEADERTRESLRKVLEANPIRTRTAMTSGGTKPVLDEGGAGHSVFATALLGVLAENRGSLEGERLYWTLQARVTQAAQGMQFKQYPTYGPIHMAGHEGAGDFVFMPTVPRP